MTLNMSPSSATVSSASGTATFRWSISGTVEGAAYYGISRFSGTIDGTGGGRSGTVTCGVGTHTFYAYWGDEDGYNTVFDRATVTVTYSAPEPSASYSIDYSSTTLTFRVTGLTSGQSVDLYARLQSDTTGASPVVNVQGITATGSTLTKTYGGLSPGQAYYANVKVDGSWLGRIGFTTPAAAVEPWDWAVSNGEATAAQTAAAYAAVTGGGSCADFHHLVWNDMCDKVQEVIDALGSSWVTHDNNTGEDLPDLESTKMTSSDKTLTAKRYNALRLNVGSRYSTGIASVSAGGSVSGQTHFVTLMSKVNEWIASI